MGEDLKTKVRRLLEGNRVTAAKGRYTRPAQKTYPHQWLWDSCFHAILYHSLGDTRFAQEELSALFRAQEPAGPDRGRLPHMTLLGAEPGEQDQDQAGKEAYARDVKLWGHPRASTISQPPILAEAVLRLDELSFWRSIWEPLAAYYDWWLRRRDPNQESLVSLWHVWESGADATPRADPACAALTRTGRVPKAIDQGTVNPTAKKRKDLLWARFLMLEDLQAIDRAEADGELGEATSQQRRLALFGLRATDVQAYLVRNLIDLARIGEAIGQTERAEKFRRAADRIADAVNRTLWDEEAGFYFDRWGEGARKLEVLTPAGLIPLYAGELVPRERAERLLTHLIDPERFWTRWPVPTVARDEGAFDPDEYWRGSTWVNVNWFIVRGLIASAERFSDERYLKPAKAIARRTVDLVERVGFREYYRSGAKQPQGDPSLEPAGFGPQQFGWSGLVLELDGLLQGPLGKVAI